MDLYTAKENFCLCPLEDNNDCFLIIDVAILEVLSFTTTDFVDQGCNLAIITLFSMLVDKFLNLL